MLCVRQIEYRPGNWTLSLEVDNIRQSQGMQGVFQGLIRA
jgi:hypothetical protein